MCKIPKEKTYENIKKLTECINDPVLLFEREEDIQIEQIKSDVKNRTNKEVMEWIKKNARSFRMYLEKVEELARKYKNRVEAMQELSIEIDKLEEEVE